MAVTNYAELQTAVADWLHRGDLTAIVPDLIRFGELRIFRELRCRAMETTLTGTITSGVVALPSDYLDLKFAYIDSDPVSKLSRTSASQIYEQYPYRNPDSKPTKIAREGTNFIFGPYPDSTYTIGGIYYAKPTEIATSVNAVFTAYPDLYLFAALIEATPYIQNDARIPVWESKYQSIKMQIENENAEEYGSGGGLEVKAA